MRIVCYHALFVIFEKVAKFETVVCCKLKVALYGLKLEIQPQSKNLMTFLNIKVTTGLWSGAIFLVNIDYAP